MGKIVVNFSNKMFYTLVAIGAIILLAMGVYAYGSAVPSTMGHSSEEIVVDDVLCNKISGHGCGTDTDTDTHLTASSTHHVKTVDTDTNTWRPIVTASSTHHVKTVDTDTNTWRPAEIPSGAVMAFDLATCPAGWTELTTARDRAIIGSGSSYSRGATGGAATHTLTISEMPSHGHTLYGPWAQHYGVGGILFSSGAQQAAGGVTGGEARPTGGGTAHNNMQPYIALLYCKKN